VFYDIVNKNRLLNFYLFNNFSLLNGGFFVFMITELKKQGVKNHKIVNYNCQNNEFGICY
jgi:hypothetical protein